MIMGVILLLDQVTKHWIRAAVSPLDTITVIPGFFQIVRTENRGIVFGLFNEGAGLARSPWMVALTTAVIVALAVYWWRVPVDQKYARLGLALVLGGAASNLYDRVIKGSVTDFLDFYLGAYHWPSFNVADSAITMGACLMLLQGLWTDERRTRKG
jgi:signal peptidase II